MIDSPPQEERYSDEISNYVDEHRELLSRVLRYGNTEARGYALALLANGGSEDDLKGVQEELENLNESEE